MLGGYDGTSNLKSCVVYDPLADAWSTITNMPDARSGMGAVALNGKIYVPGGSGDTSILKSGAVYDPATDSWSATASMSAARAFPGFVALEGKVDEDMGRLFAVGGQNDFGHTILKSAEAFTPSPSYTCTAGQCAVTAAGVSKTDCEALCKPLFVLFVCTNNTCVQASAGVPRGTCEAGCGPAQQWAAAPLLLE